MPSGISSYIGWIRVTGWVADGTVGIRAYRSEDGSSLDVLDGEEEVVESTTTLGPANSTRRFRIQDDAEAGGWHSVVVAHDVTTANGVNGVTVSLMLRGPQDLQFFPAEVVEHCTSATTETEVD